MEGGLKVDIENQGKYYLVWYKTNSISGVLA